MRLNVVCKQLSSIYFCGREKVQEEDRG